MNVARLGARNWSKADLIRQHVLVHPRLLLAALPLALAGCGSATATLSTSSPGSPGPTTPPDLAGHQFDRPDADHVLVAGDDLVLTLPTGTVRLTVGGPALAPAPALVPTKAGELHHYLATFTITATTLTGTAALAPTDFRLLAIADQVDGGAKVTSVAKVTTLVSTVLAKGATLTGTWTAPFVEGHGELLYTPVGAARPAALWDFRAES
jgi:hypothetical protein